MLPPTTPWQNYYSTTNTTTQLLRCNNSTESRRTLRMETPTVPEVPFLFADADLICIAHKDRQRKHATPYGHREYQTVSRPARKSWTARCLYNYRSKTLKSHRRGSQIPEPSLTFTSTCPLKARISQGLEPSFPALSSENRSCRAFVLVPSERPGPRPTGSVEVVLGEAGHAGDGVAPEAHAH